jgi:lycopene cyclase CruA
MKELLYIEVPTPKTVDVLSWLQNKWSYGDGITVKKRNTPDGICFVFAQTTNSNSGSNPQPEEISIFVWSLQRTTYLKVFRWADRAIAPESALVAELVREVRSQFPLHYPAPPQIDLSQQSIFEALAADYPETVKAFQQMPDGEAHLNRVYWWEQRWREGVKNPQKPKQVVFETADSGNSKPDANYDLIYVGGALGVIHAAVMARLGYRVLLVERLPFGRMNREWNISRKEFQTLIELGLFTPEEFEAVIAREYKDGFNKFFDANNPPQARAAVLHTPTVLNIGIDAEQLLRVCGDKLRAAGGDIWDETEFVRADIGQSGVTVTATHLPTQTDKTVRGRVLIDAMGTASPIAWQLNGDRTFDSVCPTVGAVIDSGFEPGVWDTHYGDVLNSHGDISRGRQLIWELFPARGEELTFYLFHYHQIHPENPGSLLEMYEDFFAILPEYRRCDVSKLKWKKPTFGYIPGFFSAGEGDRKVAFDRLISIGDAASLQSPLIFTGFGSLVRNLPRLTDLLDTALRHDLLDSRYLEQVRAYQSNISVTWLFSKGMMVPTGKFIAPERVNSMLNTFFGILEQGDPEVADDFIKDRAGWLPFNQMALRAARQNPMLLLWIWELAGFQDLVRWLGSYVMFTLSALVAFLLGWLPDFARRIQSWLEPRNPGLWLGLLAYCYRLTYGVGNPRSQFVQIQGKRG